METLKVVHEDERLLAVDKPSGLLVIAGRGPARDGATLLALATAHVGAQTFVVHRIDRETSGLVLFAKDAAAHRALCAAFESRAVRKTYLAAVAGTPPDSGEVTLALRAFGSGRVAPASDGKPCATAYRVRERFPSGALLEVEPRTGRRHQIRAHLNALGHPVLGDTLYGKDRPVGGAPRLMLHAWELCVPLPGGVPLELRAEPPEDFLAVLRPLRGDR